jgi:DnaK suppressor protein
MKARSSSKGTPSTKSSSSTPVERSARNRQTPVKKAKYPDIRRDLERQRTLILNEVEEVLTHRDKLEAFPDVSDQASAEVDQNFSMRIRERERKLLKKIDEALERMTAATYGTCERCGGDIPYKRLKARPVTTLCIECKTLQEQEEQARG